jgi:hypothetical protein
MIAIPNPFENIRKDKNILVHTIRNSTEAAMILRGRVDGLRKTRDELMERFSKEICKVESKLDRLQNELHVQQCRLDSIKREEEQEALLNHPGRLDIEMEEPRKRTFEPIDQATMDQL